MKCEISYIQERQEISFFHPVYETLQISPTVTSCTYRIIIVSSECILLLSVVAIFRAIKLNQSGELPLKLSFQFRNTCYVMLTEFLNPCKQQTLGHPTLGHFKDRILEWLIYTSELVLSNQYTYWQETIGSHKSTDCKFSISLQQFDVPLLVLFRIQNLTSSLFRLAL